MKLFYTKDELFKTLNYHAKEIKELRIVRIAVNPIQRLKSSLFNPNDEIQFHFFEYIKTEIVYEDKTIYLWILKGYIKKTLDLLGVKNSNGDEE